MAQSSRTDSYTKISEQIIASLEGGVVPWRRPWSSLLPRSERGHEYKGLNLFVLSLKSYGDPRWLTFNRVRELGGNVTKGEKATWISFWKQIEIEEGDIRRTVPLLRPFAVFNVEQCQGLELPTVKIDHCDGTPIERAEQAIQNLPWELIVRTGTAAYWNPSDPDAITLPSAKSFRTMEDYYSVAFHEICHATATADRLNRDTSGAFGDSRYGYEELLVEFASAFICAQLGIDNSLDQNSSYISSWADSIKRDPKVIFRAASQAQKVADYVLGNATVGQMKEVA